MTLTAHHLRITLDVETPIELDDHQGSALRGMVFNALRGPSRNPALGFCTQRHLTTCADCALVAVCPVAGLVATMNPQAERGRDVPRPYAIVPPLTGQTRYEPGETFTFGLTLFGEALNLFPYVVMALKQAGPGGLGKKLKRSQDSGDQTSQVSKTYEERPRRGRFQLRSAQAVNLLTGEVQDILRADSPQVQQPALPVTEAQVIETSRQLLSRPTNHAANGHQPGPWQQQGVSEGLVRLGLVFKTPTRIIQRKQLLKQPDFSPIFHRLLDRLIDLQREFGPAVTTPAPIELLPAAATDDRHIKNELLALADQVTLIDDQTAWQEVASYSARRRSRTPISGFVGQAVYEAPRAVWEVLLPYVVWGTIIHVGKNAVKGDGIIAVSRERGAGSREPGAGSRKRRANED